MSTPGPGQFIPPTGPQPSAPRQPAAARHAQGPAGQPQSPQGQPQSPGHAVGPVGHAGAKVVVTEKHAWQVSGFLALAGSLVLFLFAAIELILAISNGSEDKSVAGNVALCILAFILGLLLARPLIIIQPGQARVIQFFGRYVGTARRTGLTWVMPLTTRRPVSIKVHNFETSALKVNDADGNPVDVAAIVVWQVADTAKATFAVEDYDSFVAVQAESAVRHVATTHPYDDPTGSGTSLRGSTDLVSAELAREVASRVYVAGVQIVEVRISHLAYASEIAQAMLQRQQASAIVAARERIVEGAVGMVEMAVNRLESNGVVTMDAERKSAMVSNLLVVLCGDQKATPVVNTGTPSI